MKLVQNKWQTFASLYSSLRLLAFALLGLLTWLYYIEYFSVPATLVTALLVAGVFGFALYRFKRIQAALQKLGLQQKYYQRLLDRIEGQWHKQKSKLAKVTEVDDDHPYARDLHILENFGIHSYLDFCITSGGSQSLAELLLNQPDQIALDHNRWQARQQTIREFASRGVIRTRWIRQSTDWQNQIHSAARQNWQSIIENLQLPVTRAWCWLGILAYSVLLIITLVTLIGSQYEATKAWYLLSLPAQLTMLILIGWRSSQLARQMTSLSFEISQLHRPFQFLPGLKLHAPYWQDSAIFRPRTTRSIARLAGIAGLFQMRQNPLLYALLSFFGMHDLLYLLRLHLWLEQNRYAFGKWLRDLAHLDALQALSHLAALEKESHCFALWAKQESMQIRARQCGHPLIVKSERVNNDFELNANLFVLTGSNMSGKSTFLRSVGCNYLLAMCGAPVLASQFSFRPGHLFSSMQHTDNLQSSRSLFYTEVRRIKAIQDFIHQKKGLLLIDEMLRGTNTRERLIAQKKILARLQKSQSIVLVATHDLELTESREIGELVNLHFREHIQDGQMQFDYRLYDGVVQSSNALEILKIEGIEL